MPRLSWNWFARALALALVIASSGCRWLPIRRAQPIGLAHDPDADPPAPAALAPLPIAAPLAKPAIPPLLEPISDEEAIGSAAAKPGPPMPTPAAAAQGASSTPLLDAALARARAEKVMLIEAAHEADPAPQPQPPPQPARALAPPPPPIQPPTPPVEPVLPPPAEPGRAQNIAPTPEPDTPPEPLPIAPSSLTVRARRPGPVVQAGGDSGWDEAVDRLRSLAREQAGRDGVHRTDWEARERVLTTLAEPGQGHGRDRAWQAVATVLADPAGPPARNPPVAEAISSLDPAEARPAGPIIADLALCRRVRGFAEYDAIDAASLRAGRPVIVYSQISGLRYEPTGDKFHSRLTSRIELIRVGSRAVAWSREFEPADDVCRRPRQDYYASYPLLLPAHLEPGTYHLRLTQSDTLAGLEVSRELTLTLRP